MNIVGNLRIEVQGPNSLVLDQADQCWCLQSSNEQGIQKCYDYITQSTQLELEFAE